MFRALRSTTKLVGISLLMLSQTASADFQPETMGKIAVLPGEYPDHWILVHDASFFHMFEGEVLVIDPLGESLGDQYKGMMTASFIASFEHARKRNEHYVVESFYSRGTRGGTRTDVVTIYDPATLSVLAEVEIPAKRLSGMPKTSQIALLADERYLAIYNFTPGQSVTIVDLEAREFVGEIATSGCGFIVPNGERSFSSICSNGSFLTTKLNAAGGKLEASKTEVLFDANADPIFETPVLVDGMAYLTTFSGQILPVDVSGDDLVLGNSWRLSGESEENWRPGGMNFALTDSSGIGYFLMNPEGGEGTHKDGGQEVWAYDLEKGKRINRIELKNWGITMGTSGTGDGRLLHVTNADLAIDVYNLKSGVYLKTLNTGAATPFLIHGAK